MICAATPPRSAVSLVTVARISAASSSAAVSVAVACSEAFAISLAASCLASASDAAIWSRASCLISVACWFASEMIQVASSTEPASQT